MGVHSVEQVGNRPLPHDGLTSFFLALADSFDLILLFDEMVPSVIAVQLTEQHFGVTLKILNLHQVNEGDAFHNESQVVHRNALEIFLDVSDDFVQVELADLLLRHVLLGAVLPKQ